MGFPRGASGKERPADAGDANTQCSGQANKDVTEVLKLFFLIFLALHTANISYATYFCSNLYID